MEEDQEIGQPDAPGVPLSRRRWLQATTVAGIAVWLAPLTSRSFAALFEQHILRPAAWQPGAPRVGHRIDGSAKVCGEKVFARDVRARDMPHWPQQQAHALFLRATRCDAPYEGFDLLHLGPELQPDRVVTAADLARDGVAFPEFYGEQMLLRTGHKPHYLGHAVAILIYRDFMRYRVARERLQFRQDVLRYGTTSGFDEKPSWGAFRYVRVGGTTPYDDDVFSSLRDSPLFPTEKKTLKWPSVDPKDSVGAGGMGHAEAIARELQQPPADWLVVRRRYHSQSIDTAALEPDNANGWWDAERGELHLVVASQSPQEVAQEAATMLGKTSFKVRQIFVHPCYTVGYGSKDHSNVPFYGLVCALYGDGLPVRFAVDRFEHFQTSLKRHEFEMDYAVAVDRKTGLFQSFQAKFIANGGGRANFSPSVAMVGATAAQSVYYFPKNDMVAVAAASRAVDAGSARGYGTLQSMVATELMVDEIAQLLNLDPMELRLRNVLKSGMKNTQGAIPAGALRADEVIERARRHPIWTEREQRKSAFNSAHPEKRYGVGFACVQKDFGTGGEAAFSRVAFTREGRVAVHSTVVEIGTGAATSQAMLCVPWFGRPADEVATGITDWQDLPMHGDIDTYTITQERQDELMRDPFWSPVQSSPSSASNSAYFMGHATREAARALFEHGLWPAAVSIWSRGIGGGQAASYVLRREDARWVDGKFTANGMEPLALADIAAEAHGLGFATGIVVHSFNRWQWAESDFTVGDRTVRRPLDGMAVRLGGGGYQPVERKNVFYPPAQRNNAAVTYYSANAALVELAVHVGSGEVELLSHHSVLECGKPIVPELVSGQLQGGIAMGIGHALHEWLPLYEDGPGNGTWNFNRYHLPRAADVAVWRQTAEILPPISDTDPPKGIAEVVMIPIVAAIVNGVTHATGLRLRDLPVTAQKIRESLLP